MDDIAPLAQSAPPSEADWLDRVFRQARTHSGWQDRPVSDETLRAVVALAQNGPTAFNAQPARYVFLRTQTAKERLRPALSPSNADKTMSAPVVCIVAHDLAFPETLPQVFPHNPDAAKLFDGKPAMRDATAFRNGTLQGAYMIVAARALGLDCGPMSGFDPAKVDAEFFDETTLRSNFLLNLGHGDPAALWDRSPRLGFDAVARLL